MHKIQEIHSNYREVPLELTVDSKTKTLLIDPNWFKITKSLVEFSSFYPDKNYRIAPWILIRQ